MSSNETTQMKTWKGDFGRAYTDRNPQTTEELNALYEKSFGVTRTRLNEEFLGRFDRSIKILEVGCNVGTQLVCLKNMGFANLFGIELQGYALKKAKNKLSDSNFIQGSALNLPFENRSFDLIFTSGVLIHISPENINQVIGEMIRCTKKYIWGYEYYSKNYEMIRYRDENHLLWKADFSKLFIEAANNIKLISKRDIKYLDSENFDSMYILKTV